MAPQPIKVISSMATKEVLAELFRQYQATHDHVVSADSAGGVDVAKRVQSGEPVDVVVLASNAIDQLIADGKLLSGSRVDLVKSGIAIAIPHGARQPDICSEDAVKQAVLAAETLGYSTGPSGVYLVKLFERWGIYETIRPKIVQAPVGVPVGSLVAKGEVQLGFQQLSELINMRGITVVGDLPPGIQLLTTFSAGIGASSPHVDAARELLAFLCAPGAAATKRKQGMEPA